MRKTHPSTWGPGNYYPIFPQANKDQSHGNNLNPSFRISVYPDGNAYWRIDGERWTLCKTLRIRKYWRKESEKGEGMLNELKSYVSEYRDWFFTILIIAVVDHFFLNGALKEKLTSALGKKIDETPNGSKS